METDDDWKKPEYKNWVRGAKGLEYLHSGLQEFVAKSVLLHRDQILQDIASSVPGTAIQCNQCTGDNLLPEHAVRNDCRDNCIQRKFVDCFGKRKKGRRPCPHGFCSKLYDEIVKAHRSKSPFWKNTDPSTWCSDPAGWSFAKCFQTTPNAGTSSSETDAAGLLSIILNDEIFQNEVACNLAAPNNCFADAAKKRNTLFHSSTMTLDDTQLHDYIDTFIAVLQDPKHLLTDAASCQAVQSLVQLKNNDITISLSEEVKLVQVRMEALRALEQLQDRVEEGVSEIATQTQQSKIEIKEATSAALEEMGKSEIHKRMEQTEETIQHLIYTIQNMKKEKSLRMSQVGVISDSQDPRDEKKRGFFGTLWDWLPFRGKKTGPTDEKKKGFFGALWDWFPFRGKQTDRSPADEAYHQLKTLLKKELIEHYRSKHSTFHLSPILDDEEDTPLLEFYVMPDINVITLERAFGGGREKKTQISEFRNVFFKDGKRCSEIYLTAGAGLGKTSFSKRLTLTWCHAKDPDKEETKYLKEEEIKTMDEFDFLFPVFLRDSFEDCHIIDMVLNQIVLELELDNISREDIQNIFSNEKCLVILDGLDEWSHPENSCRRADKAIPHRKANKCTILTTLRPWKLSDIKASQVNQKLEIAGLSEESANSLKERVIPHLCAGKEEQKRVTEFNSSVEEKKISDLVKIPIMLMYFLCLFCENRELGRSLCMLYCSITDMLFCRTGKIHKEIPKLSKISQSEIPHCFRETEFCIPFYFLLRALGQLAFHTLLVETKDENTLVFDRYVVDRFLKEDCFKFCLKTGILTQSKVRGKLTKQETKVSFAHKTVQEFFAALHSATDPVSFQEKVLSKCKCFKDIMEMSTILIFVSGINANVASLILSQLISIVNDDQTTHEYRNTLTYSFVSCHQQLKKFQDLCASCCREFNHKFQHNLCLRDVFIDESCQDEQYRENLKQLTNKNTQDIRSLYIKMHDMSKTPYNTTQKVVDYFVLRDLVNIEKIYCWGENSDDLLNSSVKSLQCGDSWSPLLFERVKSLQKLEAIDIYGVEMSHSELEFLLEYLSQRSCMKEIGLRRLSCTDHGKDICIGLKVDLPYSSLRKLTLFDLPVTHVDLNMASLEECRLQELCNPDLKLKFRNCADCKLENFSCDSLKSVAAIDTVLNTLPLLNHVREVDMWYINLGTRNLIFSPQMYLECLEFFDVTMESSAFKELVDCVHELQQPVSIDINRCTISPEEEFETSKEKIKTLKTHYRILDDRLDRFKFETIKDEN